MAMVLVMGLGVVMVLLATVVIQTATSGVRQAGRDQRWQAAISAADAGVDDYLYRLNSDPSYVNYTSVPKTCTGAAGAVTPDPSNGAMSGYVPVPGGATTSQFTYSVDTSQFCTQGTISVRSTGQVNGVTRTQTALIKRRGFLDYLYFTDLETQDPALYSTNPFANQRGYNTPNDNAAAVCGRHYYDPTATSPSLPAPRPDQVDGQNPGCSNINFGGGDVFNGPVHTNDAMLVCGTVTFKGKTTTSWQGATPGVSGNRHWRPNPGCSNSPSFAGNVGDRCLGTTTNDACYAAPLTMPPSNSALKAQTDPAVSSPAGCLFSGPTKITLNSNGTMDVISPDTPRTAGSYNPGCGPLSPSLVLPTTLAVPANGVVFVQNVPAQTLYLPCFPNSNPVGYPVSNDVTPYGCTDGDAFVSGTLKGKLTIGAEHNIDVVDDVTYASGVTGNDLLGLIAQNFVEVYHPVDANGNNVSTATQNLSISAAILSVTHSFRVQNYDRGSPLGTLTVIGAIGQRYRGIVGVIGSSGYVKNYVYDTRLKYASPPQFIDPVQSAYAAASYTES